MTTLRTILSRTTLVAATLGALVLSGCTPAPHGGEGAGCAAAGTPLAELDLVADPKTHVGESTACMEDTGIEPVADDPQPALPATIVDNQGTEVTVTDTSRILALDIYGSLAATVFGLGLGDSVVGRDTSTSFDGAADLPLVTQNGHELSGEAILALNPSVIITDSSIGPWDVVLQMRDSGIPVVVVTPERSMDNIEEIVTMVAGALGVPEAGRELSARVRGEVDAEIAEIAAVTPEDPADRPRIMFLYVRGNAGVYYIFGEDSGADALITALGGVDVAGEVGWQGMRPMTAEALVKAQPDILLMMTKGLESVDGVDGLLERIPAVAQTPAGQNRRIVDMSDYEILSFGPRTAGVLDALAKAIYAPGQTGGASS
ncbi:heme/hemin ABC transporter substrate-binding protein [Compostimonas suwonensis]|uniref:Iron complex transport system substrate-binding protein n=1 Tax=Compostimonas suwonensis TaxID=1048394 RepID=A0A2M9C4N3_9MICO|nr:ABC transporter substrate-binding protein [Compostimonas suwonensis]PJJ65485.1 iron complex transport system substrate-binding protein [Compostimonas suwonensis]